MRTGIQRQRRPRPRTAAVAAVIAALVLGAAGTAVLTTGPVADRLWRGRPYPAADPDTAAERLQDRSRRVHADLRAAGLPASPPDPGDNTLRSTRCPVRAAVSTERTDRSAVGVRHIWAYGGMDGAAAREALRRAGEGLRADGWEAGFAYDDEAGGRGGVGARYEDPDTGDVVSLQWSLPAGLLRVDAESPCRTVPGGHPKATGKPVEWTPQAPFGP
ncbi:hypothetical protein [Streptomyces tsukubensis]|uniref:Lipoprotein n=2 Tax=Streptomyces TaxID=1883 RepID=A0A7G3UF20_STRT9|nr:hypothetical protein [Streptomyces tsukubensis]AZK95342.1 hypothetical protein B7R87_16875 [Streptomyces tsukubensis]QKM68608.1 hypothetical protein STSU_016920 [Streptomyces tsukubensis NRRL18488]TAI43415.1 hypothetical protein EWI31_16680 [Streptomyces tsukubensis]